MSDRYFFANIWWVLLLPALAIAAFAFPEHAHYLVGFIGLFLVFKGVYQLFRVKQFSRWSEQVGKVVGLEEVYEDVSQTPTSSIKYYYPRIEYEYKVGDTIFSSNRVGEDITTIWVPEVNQMGDPSLESDRFWSAWRIGSEISVYVNPEHPEESILVPVPNATRNSHSIALLFAGVILVFVWSGLHYFILGT